MNSLNSFFVVATTVSFISVENNIIRGEIAHSKTRDHTSM
jgi:hypothetical protein